MRLLQTFRFDATDELVFERAAASGEWAVPGTFAFAQDSEATLVGKRLQAFRSGFLGLESFGWSTFAVVAAIEPDMFERLIARLAEHFVACYGAPSLEAALPVARQELEFASSLCEHPLHTVIAVERELSEEGIRERFRRIRRPEDPLHARIWEVMPGEEA